MQKPHSKHKGLIASHSCWNTHTHLMSWWTFWRDSSAKEIKNQLVLLYSNVFILWNPFHFTFLHQNWTHFYITLRVLGLHVIANSRENNWFLIQFSSIQVNAINLSDLFYNEAWEQNSLGFLTLFGQLHDQDFFSQICVFGKIPALNWKLTGTFILNEMSLW